MSGGDGGSPVPDAEALCLAPLGTFEPPAFPVPAGACDTHAHVVTSGTDSPLVPERSYTPPPATEQDYLRMLAATGMSRGVLVQISVLGTDNRYLLSVLERHQDSLRGIAVVDPGVDEAELVRMHEAGVRGVRLNVLFGGGVGLHALEPLAAKIAPLGWHIQLLLDARSLPELLPRIVGLPVPVVVDHMGHMPAELGTEHPGFRALLRLLDEHETWVKISGAYRIDDRAPGHPAAAVFARTLLAAAPDRMVYGSDWPHVGLDRAMPDTGHLLNLLPHWVDDEAQLRRVLVDNPARLYGFEGPPAGPAS